MKYDRKAHITTKQLADLLGVPVMSVPGSLSDENAPRALGRVVAEGNRQRFYDRAEALEWIERQSAAPEPEPEPYKGEIVPPMDLPSLEALRAKVKGREGYHPSPQMQMNLERSAKVYPHRLITPEGVGNYREFASNARG